MMSRTALMGSVPMNKSSTRESERQRDSEHHVERCTYC